MSRTTLVVTNDFPPRLGGIEGFVSAACSALGGDVVVLTRTEADASATRRYDSGLPYEVVRVRGPLLPTPALSRTAVDLLHRFGARRVLYGAAAPLGLLAPALRRAGATAQLGLTHGHEVWWASVPGTRLLLARIAEGLDHVGVISAHTGARIGAALPPRVRTRLVRIPPPVDLDRFTPSATDPGPVVVAAGRFVAQKGFDRLLKAWPLVAAQVPGAKLRVVGDGPQRRALRSCGASLPGVSFTGPISYEAMPGVLRSARVFALPVRMRLGGLNSEGLGRVFVEAAASGLPVVVGRSGGAPETVVDGVSGTVVDPDRPSALVEGIVRWLAEPQTARNAGVVGRALVASKFSAVQVAATLRACLDLAGPETPWRAG